MHNIKYVPLSSIAEINPRISTKYLFDNLSVSFIPMSDVTEAGQWIFHQEKQFKDLSRQGYTPFQEGDILFAKITPCMENGKGAHAIDLINGIGFGTTEFHVLRARSDNKARFLYHWLQSDLLRLKAEALMTGSAGQRRVTPNFFDIYYIPSISPPEQEKIALVLDILGTQIQQTEQLIAKLQQVKLGLLHDLLTRGIDANGNMRDLLAHPEEFKEVSFLQNRIKIPKEWDIATLGSIVKQGGGTIQTGPFGSQLHAYEYVSDGIPVIMPQDIKDDYISDDKIVRISLEKTRKLTRHQVEFNNVIFARRGDLSRCASISTKEIGWICGTGCLLVKPPKEVIYGQWLANVYRHDYSQRQILARAVGSTMINLNTKLLSNLVITLPSYNEQVDIATKIETYNARLANEELNVAKLKQIKKGLMTDLLTGRVRVTQLLHGE